PASLTVHVASLPTWPFRPSPACPDDAAVTTSIVFRLTNGAALKRVPAERRGQFVPAPVGVWVKNHSVAERNLNGISVAGNDALLAVLIECDIDEARLGHLAAGGLHTAAYPGFQ